MLFASSLISLVIVVLALIYHCVRLNRRKTPDRPVGSWNVAIFATKSNGIPMVQDSFPYNATEEGRLRELSADEIEDEAASLAMFVAYGHADMITSDSQIVVLTDGVYGVHYFRPDYEEGHLIGVVLEDSVPRTNVA